jgi:hypothetical protein
VAAVWAAVQAETASGIGKYQVAVVTGVRTLSAAVAIVEIRHAPPVREDPPASAAEAAGAPGAAAVVAAGGK